MESIIFALVGLILESRLVLSDRNTIIFLLAFDRGSLLHLLSKGDKLIYIRISLDDYFALQL